MAILNAPTLISYDDCNWQFELIWLLFLTSVQQKDQLRMTNIQIST